jgi:acyl-CoA synthetase (AMP-forming)/AMP-acid ligase II
MQPPPLLEEHLMSADPNPVISQRWPLAPLANRRDELDADWAPWVSRSIGQHLDHCVERFGGDPFVVTDDRMWTYGELRDWSQRLAGGLVALGIASGDHVALVMANYPEFIAMKFAIASIGAVCVPVNYLLRERELSYVLQQSDAVALITMDNFRDNNFVGMLDSLMPGWERGVSSETYPSLQNVIVFSHEKNTRSWRNLNDLVAMAGPTEVAEVPNVTDLIAHCSANLARFKVPAYVVFLEAHELPMTVTGRVQKFRLAELVATRIAR